MPSSYEELHAIQRALHAASCGDARCIRDDFANLTLREVADRIKALVAVEVERASSTPPRALWLNGELHFLNPTGEQPRLIHGPGAPWSPAEEVPHG